MTELFLIIIYVGIAAVAYGKMDQNKGPFNIDIVLKAMSWPFVALSLYFKHISNKGGKDA